MHTAASENGQGMVTIVEQIGRTASGMDRVTMVVDDTSRIGSAGSTSASRQTQMTGGAALRAAEAVRDQALLRADGDRLDDEGVWRRGELWSHRSQIFSHRVPSSTWSGSTIRQRILRMRRDAETSMPDMRLRRIGRSWMSMSNSAWCASCGSTPRRMSERRSTRRR